jgi:hypothetical protein
MPTIRELLTLLSICALAACSSSPKTSKPAAHEARPAAHQDKPPAHETAPTAHEPASCPQKPLPKGCPASEPNVNHPCSRKGIECTYAPGCCPSPVYVCNASLHFEARFTRCN